MVILDALDRIIKRILVKKRCGSLDLKEPIAEILRAEPKLTQLRAQGSLQPDLVGKFFQPLYGDLSYTG